MMFFSAILDSRPRYLAGTSSSLLQLPFGGGTVLGAACAALQRAGKNSPTVLSPLASEPGYRKAIAAAAGSDLRIADSGSIHGLLAGFELSDWLLLWDGRYLATGELDFSALMAGAQRSGWAQHLIALEHSPNGTREYAQVDANGRVYRIQRFFDGVTWVRASGVVATLAPVALLRRAAAGPLLSLFDLRRALADVGVPSNDIPADRGLSDLSDMSEYLSQCQGEIARAAGANGDEWLQRGTGCRVDESARLLGPVVLQDDVTIEADVAVVGPTLIGRGARITEGALVAQSVVLPGAMVKSHTSILRSLALHTAESTAEEVAAVDSGACFARVVDVPEGGPATFAEGEAEARRHRLYLSLRRVVEAALAFLGLLVLTPILLIVAIAVKLESRGRIFFGHEREGLGGKRFRCWKFRTMVENAHLLQRALYATNAVDGPQFKMRRDPRVTRIGDFLRSTNLDELPQLWNVVLGQMSLIGPRPSPFRENQICVPWRLARLSVRPGITGLWQICRKDRDGGDFHQWISYDLLYAKHVSFWLDLKILGATVFTLGGRWSVPLGWMISERRKRRGRRGAALSSDVISYPFSRDALVS
jgi:lipopolysaccharide/colanic/teichoic acid biosynthesis glycosyltransferase/carbonic anhydrase/acetyltransferase-like protein (isoleucine patch superfamily)